MTKHVTPGQSSWEPDRPVSLWAKATAVIILLLTAYMTYQEVSIAVARADNRLVRQYATVEKVSETLSSSQDAQRVSIGPDRITLDVGDTTTVISATRPYISEGDSIEVDTWNNKVIRAEGGYVHEGWTGYYGIFLGIATIVPLWVCLRLIAESQPFAWWRRNNKSVTWGMATAVLLTATMLVVMQSSGTLYWWPLVPFIGSMIALIVAARRKAAPHEREQVVPVGAPPQLDVSDVAGEVVHLAESGAISITVVEHKNSTIVTLHNVLHDMRLTNSMSPLGSLLLQQFFGPKLGGSMCTLKASEFGPWLEQLNRAHTSRPTTQQFPAGSLARVMADQKAGAVRGWANAQSTKPTWLEGIIWPGGKTPHSVMLDSALQAIRNAFYPRSFNDTDSWTS